MDKNIVLPSSDRMVKRKSMRLYQYQGTPEPSLDMFVYKTHDTTTADEIKAYITSKGLPVRSIQHTFMPGSQIKSHHATLTIS